MKLKLPLAFFAQSVEKGTRIFGDRDLVDAAHFHLQGLFYDFDQFNSP